MKKSMRKTIADLVRIAEENDWTVSHDGPEYNFRIYSDYGQDFNFALTADTAEELVQKLGEYINGFDVSQEAYSWLDSSGHGTNGAPYEMIDVYRDMESCLESCVELLHHWKNN